MIATRLKRLKISRKRWVQLGRLSLIMALLGVGGVFGIVKLFGEKPATRSKQDEIISMLKDERIDRNAELIAKYPMGFALFYVNVKTPILYMPQSTLETQHLMIDFSRIVVDTSDFGGKPSIILRNVFILRKNGPPLVSGDTWELTGDVGGKREVARNMFGTDVWLEVLKREGGDFICVLGLTPSAPAANRSLDSF